MKTREYYEAELAKAEERIESLLRVERRLIAERGRGFRHPFYHKRIIQLDDRIFNLRAKLDSIGCPGCIKTRRGMGYQL